jgi:hypothetical protein
LLDEKSVEIEDFLVEKGINVSGRQEFMRIPDQVDR